MRIQIVLGHTALLVGAIDWASLGCSTRSEAVVADEASTRMDAARPNDASAPRDDAASGDASACGIPECFRSINCRSNCTGPVVVSGCCPCPSPYFDDICCTTNSCP
jgi:hypothetical protein